MRRVFATLVLALVVVGFSVASASTSRTLTVFHSDRDMIGFNPQRLISVHLLDYGFTSEEFLAYVNHARDQWARAGIHTAFADTGTLPAMYAHVWGPPSIRVFGGTRVTLERERPALANHSALTIPLSWPQVGTHTFNGRPIANHSIDAVEVWVPRQPWWYLWWHADYYRHAFTHELGHALGWIGHSPNSRDVMYPRPGRRPILTTRDIEHLRQNY